MNEPDWKGMAHAQIALGIDTPEALEMRGLVVASLYGLAVKSKGPHMANLQIFAILYHCVAALAESGRWEQMLKIERSDDCKCAPCVIRRKVMEVLDEVRKAHESGELVDTTKEAMKGI